MRYLITILLLLPSLAGAMTPAEYAGYKANILGKVESKTLKLSEFKDFKFIMEVEKTKFTKKPIKVSKGGIIAYLISLIK